MRLPLPQLTTILLLVHMGLGCCTHHTHACESDCCSTPVATAESCPCGTHEHGNVSADSEHELDNSAERDHDGQQHQCAGGPCTFVFSQPSPERIDEGAANIDTLEAVTVDSDAGKFRCYRDRNLDQRPSIAGASLRTHLALRVLLI